MDVFDGTTPGIVESEGRYILPVFEPSFDTVFKASYIVASNIKCSGKITALFDLIVIGDVEAEEIDVKGKFVCLGNCTVNSSVTVQNEIWANDLRASNIESHDRIFAQSIDSDTVNADGSIVVGKILAVEKIAETNKKIICGETVYGAGKAVASVVITGDPIDLDGGENSVEFPKMYQPLATQSQVVTTPPELADLLAYGESIYAPSGDYVDYLDFLIMNVCDKNSKIKFARWQKILNEAEAVKQGDISRCSDIAIIVWLAEIAWSDYFINWDAINDIFDTFESHFKELIARDKNAVNCTIDCYNLWLEALLILERFGDTIDKAVYNVAFELVISKLGLKAKFVSERLRERGWNVHAE
jgi:hypothetical protein